MRNHGDGKHGMPCSGGFGRRAELCFQFIRVWLLRRARPVRLRDAVVIVALSVLMAAAAAAAVLLASGWMGAGQAQWRALRLDGLPVSGGEASGELRWSHGLRGWRHFFAVERCGHLAYMTWQHGERRVGVGGRQVCCCGGVASSAAWVVGCAKRMRQLRAGRQ